VIIIQTTIGSEEDARELTNYLVNKQLIACGTFNKIQSIYKWEGEIQQESEYEHDQLIETLQEKHTYELPKITTIKPTYTLPEYDDWVNKETI
jgi:periplasmic divalent cation tolerance protein